MQCEESKKKVQKWFEEARSTYNFIHFSERFKPVLKLVKCNDDTCTIIIEKVG